MPKSPEEMANSMIANLKKNTGKSLEQWIAIIQPSTKSRVDLGLNMKSEPARGRLVRGINRPGSRARIAPTIDRSVPACPR